LLGRMNIIRQLFLQSISQGISNYFIDDITETNWSKVRRQMTYQLFLEQEQCLCR
jgi:hypothetical protein